MTVSIRSSLQIIEGKINYQSQPTAFNPSSPTNVKGPSPGAITVGTGGTDVDLSELVRPGLCRIMNLDSTNYVSWGVYDADSGNYFPLGEILPGESYVIRFSRELGTKETPGTGTVSGAELPCTYRFKAHTDSCNVLVEAFDS